MRQGLPDPLEPVSGEGRGRGAVRGREPVHEDAPDDLRTGGWVLDLTSQSIDPDKEITLETKVYLFGVFLGRGHNMRLCILVLTYQAS